MSDDFKISLDIEGNLTRLDNMLSQAEQKVTSSAMRMQTGIKNGIGEALAHRLGISFVTPTTAAIGTSQAVLRGATALLEYTNTRMASERGFRTSSSFAGSSAYGPYGAGEQLRGIQTGLDNWQAPGLLGMVPGVGALKDALIRRKSEQNLREGKSTLDFNALAQSSDEAAGLQKNAAYGFGGYTGEMAALSFERKQASTHIQSVRMSQGNDAANKLAAATDKQLSLSQDKIEFFNKQNMANITSYTAQSRLGAMGLGKYGDVLETQRSFNRQIELAKKQNQPELAGMLTNQMNAQLSEQFMGNISPAQELSAPQALGAGSVRLGSVNGQNDAYLSFLSKIAQNTGSSTPVFGHN